MIADYEDVSDDKLLDRITNGDTAAERQLFTKYKKPLYFILRKQNISHDIAEDIHQETFLLVISKARKNEIQKASAVGAFIRSTAINLVIAHKRTKTRRKTDLTEDIDQINDSTENEIVTSINRSQLVSLVQKVIDTLPVERDRLILKHMFLYEQDKAHICKQLEVSKEHFDKVLFRAKQRLKASLADNYDVDLVNYNLCKYLVGFLIFSFVSYNIPYFSVPYAQNTFNVLAHVRDSTLSPHNRYTVGYLSAKLVFCRAHQLQNKKHEVFHD